MKTGFLALLSLSVMISAGSASATSRTGSDAAIEAFKAAVGTHAELSGQSAILSGKGFAKVGEPTAIPLGGSCRSGCQTSYAVSQLYSTSGDGFDLESVTAVVEVDSRQLRPTVKKVLTSEEVQALRR